MNIRIIALNLLLFSFLPSFAQDSIRKVKVETRHSYLDSIKATFEKDDIAACVDSLWMKELTNIDLYNDLSTSIKHINIDEKVDYELPTELLKSRLAAMDAKSPFNIEYNQGLENIIKSFLKNRKKSFERLMAISEYYFPMFEEAMAKQNVPLEIKYLAVVESALNPKAVSRVGATGLWQFMYHTGKQYKLDIDSYVDERSDPLKASEAAASYMANMHKIFGDWDLVLASYNSGPGNVAKAIRRSGGHQNFWNIRKHLPKETQGYVPAFLATMYIYEYHKEHGIVPNRAMIKHFATDTIMVKQQISFKQISDLLDIPVAQLQLLNPSYKRDVIPFIAGEENFLRLPTDKIGVYTSNEAKVYAYVQYEANKREKPYQNAVAFRDTLHANSGSVKSGKTKYYKVRRGDDLTEIASKYGVAVSEIKKWNRLKSDKVPAGRSLKIHILDPQKENQSLERNSIAAAKSEPTKSESTSDSKVNPTEKQYKIEKVVSMVNKTLNYKIKSGDNLGEIAAKHDVSVADIKKWNKLKSNSVAAGKTLKIQTSERVVTKVKREIKMEKSNLVPKTDLLVHNDTKEKDTTKNGLLATHIVQSGDNLKNIAAKYALSVEDLKKWNNLSSDTIQLGSTLNVAGIANTTNEIAHEVNSSSSSYYVVVQGDNLTAIAKKHHVSPLELKAWNHLTDNTIALGSTLIVSKTEIEEVRAKKKDKLTASVKSSQSLYSVKKGDSLFSIAKKHPGITISDIKKWNGIKNEDLKPGMKLKMNG